MDLGDVLGQDSIHEDKWSKTLPRFGKDNQISVLGWIRKTKSGTKAYLMYCATCAQDPELFGEGYFRIRKGDLVNNLLACGCGGLHKWTEDQYKIKLTRELEGSNVSFVEWSEPFNGSNTRIRALCSIHGVFETARTLGGQLYKGINAGMCLECSDIKTIEDKITEKDRVIKQIIAEGGYPEGTTISYSGLKVSPTTGTKSRCWEVYCPVCNVTYVTKTSYLMRLSLGCDCSLVNQTKAYINKVYDGDQLLGLKFGISQNPRRRRGQIQMLTYLNVILTDVFLFEKPSDCRKAEKMCKDTLICGVIRKEMMPGGYTETVSINNYGEIVKIYESFGGKRVDLAHIST